MSLNTEVIGDKQWAKNCSGDSQKNSHLHMDMSEPLHGVHNFTVLKVATF